MLEKKLKEVRNSSTERTNAVEVRSTVKNVSTVNPSLYHQTKIFRWQRPLNVKNSLH